jgi:uncharacterized Zn finger protein (UPF0148 family)
MQVSICSECGQPFDTTGYDICPDCTNLTHFKLRIPNEEANNKSRQDEKSSKSSSKSSFIV